MPAIGNPNLLMPMAVALSLAGNHSATALVELGKTGPRARPDKNITARRKNREFAINIDDMMHPVAMRQKAITLRTPKRSVINPPIKTMLHTPTEAADETNPTSALVKPRSC